MATSVRFTWISPPSVIVGNLASFEQRVIQALGQLADLFTAKLESYAKANAPWTDRTGAARQGLRAFAVKAAMQVTLYLVTSVNYGIFLELGTSRMAPRPIVMPTLEAHYGEIMAAARALIGGR